MLTTLDLRDVANWVRIHHPVIHFSQVLTTTRNRKQIKNKIRVLSESDTCPVKRGFCRMVADTHLKQATWTTNHRPRNEVKHCEVSLWIYKDWCVGVCSFISGKKISRFDLCIQRRPFGSGKACSLVLVNVIAFFDSQWFSVGEVIYWDFIFHCNEAFVFSLWNG